MQHVFQDSWTTPELRFMVRLAAMVAVVPSENRQRTGRSKQIVATTATLSDGFREQVLNGGRSVAFGVQHNDTGVGIRVTSASLQQYFREPVKGESPRTYRRVLINPYSDWPGSEYRLLPSLLALRQFPNVLTQAKECCQQHGFGKNAQKTWLKLITQEAA